MNIDDTIYVNYIPTISNELEAGSEQELATIGSASSPNTTPANYEQTNDIRATRGTIGGWNLTISELYNRDVRINSAGFIELGTGNDIVRIDAQDATYRIWVGHATAASAPFSVTKAGVMSATSGAIGGWTIGSTFIADNATAANANVLIDSANTLIRLGPTSGDYITLDGANQRIRSSNYSAGVSGFTIEPGLVEAQNIRARGVLQSAVFQKDIISAIGGVLLVANADALDADMTASDSSTLTIKGDTTFAVNDILRIKDGTDDEWLRVTNAASAPTYTVTRDLAAAYSSNANPVWRSGQAVVKQGVSNGTDTYSGGWLQLFGEGTNSPYYSIFRRNGVAYNAYEEVGRIGNLNGIGGFSADTFGIFFGDSTTGNYMQYDTTSGDMIINDSQILGQLIYGDGSDGNVTTAGNVTLSADVYANNYTISAGDTVTTNGWRLFVKGTLTIEATGQLGWLGNAGGNAPDETGNAGTAGAALTTSNYLYGSVAGVAGTAGGDSGTVNAVVGNNGNNGVAHSLGSNGVNGGAGGNGTGGNGAAGGTGGTEGTAVVNGEPHNAFLAITGIDDSDPTSPARFTANASGGSGAGGGFGTNGNGGGGGGSGSGVGVAIVCARKIVNAGTITVAGGKGGDGGNATTGFDGGGGGGGAPGNGGVLLLVYGSKTGAGTVTVAAGAIGVHGNKQGGGIDGSDSQAGNAGLLIELIN